MSDTNVSIPAKIVAFLSEIGKERELAGMGACLCIPLAILHDATSTRTRSTDDQRAQWISTALENPTLYNVVTRPDESYGIPALALCDLGFPEASALNPAYWSGIAGGSHAAFLCGYRASLKFERDGAAMVPYIVVRPLTDKERATHASKVRKAAEKAARAAAKKKTTDGVNGEADDAGDSFADEDATVEE